MIQTFKKLDNKDKLTLDPDKYAQGVLHFHETGKLNKLMELHSDWYLKTVLTDHPGTSFLDIIGPSDIAYVIRIIKNSKDVWLESMSVVDENAAPQKKKAQALFKKRVLGVTIWNNEGMQYNNRTLKKWQQVFGQMDKRHQLCT